MGVAVFCYNITGNFQQAQRAVVFKTTAARCGSEAPECRLLLASSAQFDIISASECPCFQAICAIWRSFPYAQGQVPATIQTFVINLTYTLSIPLWLHCFVLFYENHGKPLFSSSLKEVKNPLMVPTSARLIAGAIDVAGAIAAVSACRIHTDPLSTGARLLLPLVDPFFSGPHSNRREKCALSRICAQFFEIGITG